MNWQNPDTGSSCLIAGTPSHLYQADGRRSTSK